VSWFHAFEYCMGNGFLLPTDEQWEYAARGPEGHKYGTQSGRLNRKEAHFDSAASADVGSYPPNSLGLYDMTGNVWEWTSRNSSEEGVYGRRGGCWEGVTPEELNVANRCGDLAAKAQESSTGFRVVAAVPRGSK